MIIISLKISLSKDVIFFNYRLPKFMSELFDLRSRAEHILLYKTIIGTVFLIIQFWFSNGLG